MEGSAPLYRALIALFVLVIGAEGLRAVNRGEDCSQPGIQCTIKNSSCFDFSWLQTFKWTPNAPSHMEVTVAIGQNELGRREPFLQIKWNISIDSSIKELQGVKISVLEISTNLERCIQFQFNDRFTSQFNENGQPWQFSSNNFEVDPGKEYYVTVQHLPKQEGINNKTKQIHVPWCNEGDMMQTQTCYDLGFHWYPNITLTHEGNNLTVEFTSQWDAKDYGVEVKVRDTNKKPYQKVLIQQGPPVQRVQATFPHIGGYEDKECVYNISVWPYMPPCGNDCVRLYYVPPCPKEAPSPAGHAEPVKRRYLWAVAIVLTIACFGGIVLTQLKGCSDHLYTGGAGNRKKNPPPQVRKVWFVYSADNKHYVNAVIGLSDFMRQAWGIDVVVDRFHVQKMGIIGPMAWLAHQKSEIEKTEGTILLLCSRGMQEKWKAMQEVKKQECLLREDREHLLGDLCTPALSLIIPDFQYAKPYDRYVVAYFSNISKLADIPSLLNVCPSYSLTENLQDVFFRIQRQEQYQPGVQLMVNYDEHPSYKRLVKAIERCREWQEQNSGWFEKECLITPVENLKDTEEEEDVDYNATRKVSPVVRCPETSVCMVEPVIVETDPAKVLDPTIVIGSPSTHVEPSLSDVDPSLSILQPLLEEVSSAAVCIQEPQVVGDDPSLELNRYPLTQEVSIQSDRGALSREQLMEAQKHFFQNSFASSYLPSAMDIMEDPSSDFVIPSMGQADIAGERLHEILTPAMDLGTGLVDRHSVQLADQGYSSWNPHEMDIKEIQKESLKFFMQNQGHLLNFEQV